MTDRPEGESEPRREYPRLSLGIEASLETLDGRQKVRLIDLSQAGAHLVLSETWTISEGVLRWLQFDTFGMAVWQQEDDVGLKFDRLLPPYILRETADRAPQVVLEIAQAWVSGAIADD